jgi:hypothetical protein
MINTIVKDSCLIVYVDNRIGRPCYPCDGTQTDGIDYSNLEPQGVKFELNGCRKVNRDDKCNVRLYRDDR